MKISILFEATGFDLLGGGVTSLGSLSNGEGVSLCCGVMGSSIESAIGVGDFGDGIFGVTVKSSSSSLNIQSLIFLLKDGGFGRPDSSTISVFFAW